MLSENLMRSYRYVTHESSPVYGHYGYDADFSDYGHSLKAAESRQAHGRKTKGLIWPCGNQDFR